MNSMRMYADFQTPTNLICRTFEFYGIKPVSKKIQGVRVNISGNYRNQSWLNLRRRRTKTTKTELNQRNMVQIEMLK